MSIYENFESLDKVEKLSYVLGSELWRVSLMNCLAWLRNTL